MRSPNIVIALAILNSVALISGVIFPAEIVMTTGAEGEIDNTIAELRSCVNESDQNCARVNQPSSDEITGGFIRNIGVIQAIDDLVFMGPNMLANLGMPTIFVTGFKSVLAFVVAFDIVEFFTGRESS